MAQYLLHGTLLITIFEIDRLHGGCGFNFFGKPGGPEKMSKKFLSQLKKMVLCRPEIVGSRLYATIDLEKARVGRTRMIENDPYNPRWYESFRIYCAHMVSNIIFTVKNNDPIGATLIGRAYFPIRDIISGQEVDRWIEILDEDRNPIRGGSGSNIHVKIQFIDVARDGTWSQGMNIPGFIGVPRTFFKQRQGCNVVLYQDAHVPDDQIAIRLRSIGLYDSNRCWEDIFDAITNAKHLIYITGWSVYTKITLIRDPRRPPKPGEDLNLGDLLINKANEGVRVLMLVWDDRTSVEEFKKDGLMATHDQETADFFQGTKVNCVLCPRNPDGGDSVFQGVQVSTMFTHHQKTVIVDAEISGDISMRRIVSFLGGIDLCDGRYDTREHHLFRTLNTVHSHDFHQPNFPESSISKGGPREPWHDIHCRIEGPAAWDVLYNFEQRWKKQAKTKDLFSLKELRTFTISPSPVKSTEDLETWNVQVLRSIDGGAAFGFPEKPEEAAEVGLVSGKDNIIDRSIQDAYINAIRRANNFIYIENQYFVGSSFGWEANDIIVGDINALHLIPKELSLKIISKIEAEQRFTVYIVIPMWPEGIPESGSVQAILDWQRRTMEMMYKDIAQALKAKGIAADLRDYLTFFCLGNREAKREGEYIPPEKPDPNTDYSRAQEARRFMVYVHSKMMIVDDEYIIVGSANINQRSMDGGRDSEIAIGAYQPNQLASKLRTTERSKINRFRLALWQEHLDELEDEFQQPESLACVKRVNQIADENWVLYTSDTLEVDLPGHLLRYPMNISSDGVISALPGFEYFPDTKARVLGTKSELIPPILTT